METQVSRGLERFTADGLGQVSHGQGHKAPFCFVRFWGFGRNLLRIDRFKQTEIQVCQMGFEVREFLTKSTRRHAETVTMATRLTTGDFSNPEVGVQQDLQKQQGEKVRCQQEYRQHLDDDGFEEGSVVVTETSARLRVEQRIWVNDKVKRNQVKQSGRRKVAKESCE